MLGRSTQPPLVALLRAISEERNAEDRRSVALGLNPFSTNASLHFDVTQAQLLGDVKGHLVREQAAIATVFHLFWKLIPERIFQPGEPNYARLAAYCLDVAGVPDPGNSVRRALTVVYKRLREQHFEGRDATSLDLSRADHDDLMRSQQGRCAACGYSFTKSDIDLYLEDEYTLRSPHVPVMEHEVVLETIMRSPVLDHILPVFLGGDGPANWQILCRSCNAGKGETWSAIVRGAAPPRVVDEVLCLRPMLRYVVFAEYIRTFGVARNELRVVKRDPSGLVTLHNLVGIPRD